MDVLHSVGVIAVYVKDSNLSYNPCLAPQLISATPPHLSPTPQKKQQSCHSRCISASAVSELWGEEMLHYSFNNSN